MYLKLYKKKFNNERLKPNGPVVGHLTHRVSTQKHDTSDAKWRPHFFSLLKISAFHGVQRCRTHRQPIDHFSNVFEHPARRLPPDSTLLHIIRQRTLAVFPPFYTRKRIPNIRQGLKRFNKQFFHSKTTRKFY